MAVAFDATAEVERTGTTDPQTWTHTPVGTPRAIVVTVVHPTSTTDHVSSVTYGGVAMTRIVRITSTSAELGAAEEWFLGSGIPTGPQTVSADLASGTGDDMHFVSVSYTAAADCEVVDFDSTSGIQANPSRTLQYGGRTCAAVACGFFGSSSPSNFTPNANCTMVNTFDFGINFAYTLRQTTPGSSDFAIGGTVASDDTAFVALALSEVAGGGGSTQPPRTMQQARLRRAA